MLRRRRERRPLPIRIQRKRQRARRMAMRGDILAFGCAEALRRDFRNAGDVRQIVDVLVDELMPTLEQTDKLYEELANLKARTRKIHKPLRTAQKSAKSKKK